ncbi:MAG: hypothetical protein EOQ60_32150, partial [Mesorhizobium sp.]
MSLHAATKSFLGRSANVLNECTRPTETNAEKLVSEGEARRDFLKKAGRFAAVTPPAITVLL